MGIRFVAAMTMIVVAAAATGSAAQSTPECASKLVGCAQYLNSTTPPDTCCGPLKQEAKDDLPCLCALFNNTAVLKAFNVNITQALQMAKRCGVNADQSTCATVTASPSATPPSSSTNNTSSPAGKSDNSAHGVASIGLPGLVSLLLCWWSLIA
ncbi:unnamed protein product [Musa acuminata subsp. malaccensis]|uniref:(wild Malaysian banana) hypothetical protein n=1 Tax=Musa acuminata subsp. malaccensis TaxID=214687 RepID=A0A804KNC2_MUSAM|nr:PREDICTED: lipid transfer-like protein VAS isoform X2 [Musa acuminata subsp. malaccensis]CAG1836368.1 unnamed protein product [Musa acuminata subsp. malaccensis]